MYVVGVSSKLSNTIFTYKMCCLSFLSLLASIFLPFFFHRQEEVWLLFGKQGHLNTPAAALTIHTAVVNHGFGVSEEQGTSISEPFWSIMSLTQVPCTLLLCQALGTPGVGCDSKAAVTLSPPWCLSWCLTHCLPPFPVWWLWSGEQPGTRSLNNAN